MFAKILAYITSFFPCQIQRQIRELYASTIILNFALSMVAIFEPVFLYLFFAQRYNLRDSLLGVLFFYLAVYVAYFFMVPLGGKIAKRLGYEYTIALGCVFTALFYFSLFAINFSPWFLVLSVINYVLWKILYWPAYHSNFSKFSVDGEQGRELSNLSILQSFVFIAGSFFGGVLVEFLGFKSLFVLAAIIMVLSNIPMIITKEFFIVESFSYIGTFKKLFAKKNLRRFFSYCGFGEDFIVLTLWPIFMYLIVDDFLKLGSLTAVATMIMTLAFLYIGKLSDSKGPAKILKFGSVLYFFGWMFRLFSRNIIGIFFVDSYSRLTKQSIVLPIVAQIYKEANKGDEMEEILFFEMALIIGKIVAMIMAIILLFVFGPSWNALFILGGLMGLLYLLFKLEKINA